MSTTPPNTDVVFEIANPDEPLSDAAIEALADLLLAMDDEETRDPDQ